MAEYYNIGAKEQTTFRIDKNLYDDLINYSKLEGINKAEAINEILFSFFKGSVLTNTYLPNKARLYFKIPLEKEYINRCIKNKTILNKDNDSTTIGENTITVKIKQIPNNLDIFAPSNNNKAKSFQTSKDGVLHSGIDFIFIFEAVRINQPTTPSYGQIINLLDYLYCFYFEVTADNKTNVYLINPYEAINKLSDVNNRIVGDRLIDIVEHLEEIQQQANFNYKIGVDNLEATNKTVSSKKQFEWLDTSFMKLLIALNEFNENIQNENIKLPKITANTPTRLMPPSYE